MSDASRLVKAMQTASQKSENEKVDIITGTVTSVSPLKIKTDKIELTETFLVLGALCKSTTIKIPERDANTHKHKVPQHTTQPAGEDPHTHTINEFYTEVSLPDILLWRGLQVGDEVYMIRFSEGQKYYVLQRKEGIT